MNVEQVLFIIRRSNITEPVLVVTEEATFMVKTHILYTVFWQLFLLNSIESTSLNVFSICLPFIVGIVISNKRILKMRYYSLNKLMNIFVGPVLHDVLYQQQVPVLHNIIKTMFNLKFCIISCLSEYGFSHIITNILFSFQKKMLMQLKISITNLYNGFYIRQINDMLIQQHIKDV